MKKILITFIFALNGYLGVFAQNNINIKSFSFDYFLRGSYGHTLMTADSVFIFRKNYSDAKKDIDYRGKLSEKEWNSLLNSIKDLNLDAIRNLRAPTNYRSGDGASYSSISISTSENKIYKSAEFDGHNPHEKLSDLMHVIEDIEKIRL